MSVEEDEGQRLKTKSSNFLTKHPFKQYKTHSLLTLRSARVGLWVLDENFEALRLKLTYLTAWTQIEFAYLKYVPTLTNYT